MNPRLTSGSKQRSCFSLLLSAKVTDMCHCVWQRVTVVYLSEPLQLFRDYLSWGVFRKWQLFNVTLLFLFLSSL